MVKVLCLLIELLIWKEKKPYNFQTKLFKNCHSGLLYGESQKKFNELQRATVASFAPRRARMARWRINRHTDDELRLENP